MKNIPSNLYPKVLELINETYFDKMDSIESAQVDERGIIQAIAIDEGVRYVCRYADGAIEIKALDPGEKPKTGSFAAGKPRNCKTGISCGGSCISKSKTCRKKGTSTQAEKAKEITALVWQPGKGSSKDIPAKAKKSAAKAKKATEKKAAPTEKKASEKASPVKSSEELKKGIIERTEGRTEKSTEMLRAKQKEKLDGLGEIGDVKKLSQQAAIAVLLDYSLQDKLDILGFTPKQYKAMLKDPVLQKQLYADLSKKVHPDVNKDPRAEDAMIELIDLLKKK